jgi:aldose 1-epimerase
MMPTGKLIPEEYDNAITVGNKEFDTGFVLDNLEEKASTEIYDPELDLRIIVWQETGKWKYNYLQVFIPPNRRSIAVEPMTCAADALNNRTGLMVLEPQQSFAATCGVYLA